MRKNGFTLIEILISLTLVSIVLITMLSTLVRLKDVYAKANDDTDVRLYGAIISRKINSDVLANGGIKPTSSDVTCSYLTENENLHSVSCDINLNSGLSRRLILRVASVMMPAETNDSTGKRFSVGINRSTIEYYDVDNQEVLLLKTISSKDIYSLEGETTLTESKYYHYTDILVSDPIVYPSKTAGKNDIIRTITIKSTKSEYDVKIFSAGTF